ncbi:MAG: DUF1800 family protein [Ilumatobacter sp.]|uniref:DUF1800 family protein n=1 Tax=Ilumatobacter sp. TaxID=1967498 RepID=UPI003299E91E
MPALDEGNVRHLLRRTEVVDRPQRVAALLALPSLEAAVDDVMNVVADPPTATLDGPEGSEEWRRGIRLSDHWLGRMASTTRPFAERMAFFWHGHLATSIDKVGSADLMRDQIDLFRRRGLGAAGSSVTVTELVSNASLQLALLRYLDNHQNFASSPNQNFARELMELFLLGVGNYTEADVEASTAAWTGHTHVPTNRNAYFFDQSAHEPTSQVFLGRTINATRPPQQAGIETIEVILGTGPLGSGIVPMTAERNGGRETKAVAAEFLTFKLWQEFGEATTGSVPAGVGSAMTGALLGTGFEIRPWVRAMLLHDDFYSATAQTGLVRQPVEFMVALLVATGLDTRMDHIPNWLLASVGQQPLYPPNVSGWRPNGYWVNAGSMSTRHGIVEHVVQKLRDATWYRSDAHLRFGPGPGDVITRSEVEGLPAATLVDRFAALTGVRPTAATRAGILEHLGDATVDPAMRVDALSLLLSAPSMHIA